MANRVSGKPRNRQSARDLLRWLLLVPIAFLILFGCGQLALSSAVYPPAPDTRSKLRADYGAWPMAVIPAINPAIIDDIRRDEHLNPTVIARAFWPTSDRPAATSRPTLIAQEPTSTSTPPAGTSTPISTQTSAPSPTRTATLHPTRTVWPTPTSTLWPTATDTPWPTATARPPQPNTRTHTPTSAPLLAPTNTETPSQTATPTVTFTPASTSTDTPTPTNTATPTSTATSTPTPTITPQPCSGNSPSGEPNIGLPNGSFADIPCGVYLTIDLDSVGAPRITSHPGYDFVDYEVPGCAGICLDWVQIDVCGDPCAGWVPVFNWGDGIPDNNTNVASYTAGGEMDNASISASDLHNNIGITIDVDPFGIPAGGYRYLRIYSPINWPNNDGAQVDSIEIVP